MKTNLNKTMLSLIIGALAIALMSQTLNAQPRGDIRSSGNDRNFSRNDNRGWDNNRDNNRGWDNNRDNDRDNNRGWDNNRGGSSYYYPSYGYSNFTPVRYYYPAVVNYGSLQPTQCYTTGGYAPVYRNVGCASPVYVVPQPVYYVPSSFFSISFGF